MEIDLQINENLGILNDNNECGCTKVASISWLEGLARPLLCGIVPQINENLGIVNDNNEDVDAQRQLASAC